MNRDSAERIADACNDGYSFITPSYIKKANKLVQYCIHLDKECQAACIYLSKNSLTIRKHEYLLCNKPMSKERVLPRSRRGNRRRPDL